MIKFPAFNEENTKIVNVNRKADRYKIFDASADFFDKYCDLFSGNGYELKQQHSGIYKYAAFLKDQKGIFVTYFGRTNELQIVVEKECNYFEFSDNCDNAIVTPQITQLDQEDFGMSYAIRLSDGRFIVIDGGNNFEVDIDRLMNCLKKGSPFAKPVIAAWIMTHEHGDHYLAYIGFDDKYAGQYEVQSFILNFMELDDERFPGADITDKRQEINTSRLVNVPIMFSKMKKSGAPIYMAHTGQIFEIGDAKIEFLSTLDETVDFMRANINATSLVFRMELGSQVTLWTGDATFSEAKLPQRYGNYLKADILQIPHHGFEGPIDPEVELEGYILAEPNIALLPVSEYNAFTTIGSYRVGPRYLYQHSDISEIIVGGKDRTITLPYIPESYRRNEFKEKFCQGISRSGATTWVFNNLYIENEDDVTFNFFNLNSKEAEISVEMFFIDNSKNLGDIKIKLKGGMEKINITDKESIITDSVRFTWMSPDVKGFPENGEFAVRFISDIPVIISNKNQSATYTGKINYEI